MKFMILVKASEKSEAGVMPGPAEFQVMGAFNQEMMAAGVMVDAAGLTPTSQGARIFFDDDAKTVQEGPFGQIGELVSGFWIIDVKSKEEAMAWAMKAPNPSFGGKTNIEVRRFFDMSDFA